MGRPVRFQLLVPPLAVSSRVISNRSIKESNNICRHVLSARRERGRRAGARGPRHRRAVPHPDARPPGRARRPRRAREVADGLGQDARLRHPARRARRRPTARRPSSLVLVPTRELALQVADELEPLAAAKGVRVGVAYGGAPVRLAGEAPQGRAHRRRHAGPPPGSRRAEAHRRSTPSRSSSSTRPTGCSTWASARRSSGSSAACRRSGRRCSSRRRSTARSASSPGVHAGPRRASSTAARLERRGRRHRARFRPGHRTTTRSTGSIELLEAEPGLSLVFVRTKRGADRLAQKLARRDVDVVAMHGDMTQSQRERALEQLPLGPRDDARRHRRGRPRPRPRRRSPT